MFRWNGIGAPVSSRCVAGRWLFSRCDIDRTSAQCRILEQQATAYKIRYGDYPGSLDALTQPSPDGNAPPLEPEALVDPWGHQYQYDPSGGHSQGRKPDVWTTTQNGKQIGNWKNR